MTNDNTTPAPVTDPAVLPERFPRVTGQCPTCGRSSLMLAAGGYVTCASLSCRDPEAASNMLAPRPEPVAAPEGDVGWRCSNCGWVADDTSIDRALWDDGPRQVSMVCPECLIEGSFVDHEPLVEAIAAEVHEAWMQTKRDQGVESRPSEWGEEQMVPYADLSERAKDLDRSTVRAVLDAQARVHTPRPEPAADQRRPVDPWCPEHGDQPTTYDECSCKARAEMTRPGPVADPLPSEAVDVTIDDACKSTVVNVAHIARSGLRRDGNGYQEAAREALEEIVRRTPTRLVERAAALVPEDDEDTVRVPREAVERLRDMAQDWIDGDDLTRWGNHDQNRCGKAVLAALDGAGS